MSENWEWEDGSAGQQFEKFHDAIVDAFLEICKAWKIDKICDWILERIDNEPA